MRMTYRKITLLSISLFQLTGESQAGWNPFKCKSACSAHACKTIEDRQGECVRNCSSMLTSACRSVRPLKNAEIKALQSKQDEHTRKHLTDLERMKSTHQSHSNSVCQSKLTKQDIDKLVKNADDKIQTLIGNYIYTIKYGFRQTKIRPNDWTEGEIISEKGDVRTGKKCQYQLRNPHPTGRAVSTKRPSKSPIITVIVKSKPR